MKNNAIIIGLHDKKRVPGTAKKVGHCLFCEKPVYLALVGITGELAIKQISLLKNPRFMGMPCVQEVIEAFKKLMDQNHLQRQGVINALLKEEHGR